MAEERDPAAPDPGAGLNSLPSFPEDSPDRPRLPTDAPPGRRLFGLSAGSAVVGLFALLGAAAVFVVGALFAEAPWWGAPWFWLGSPLLLGVLLAVALAVLRGLRIWESGDVEQLRAQDRREESQRAWAAALEAIKRRQAESDEGRGGP